MICLYVIGSDDKALPGGPCGGKRPCALQTWYIAVFQKEWPARTQVPLPLPDHRLSSFQAMSCKLLGCSQADASLPRALAKILLPLTHVSISNPLPSLFPQPVGSVKGEEPSVCSSFRLWTGLSDWPVLLFSLILEHRQPGFPGCSR